MTGKAFNDMMFLMKIILIVCGLIIVAFSFSYADVYEYIAEDGVVSYTDLPIGKKAEIVIREKVKSTPSQQQADRTDYKNTTNYHSIVHEKATKYNVDPLLVKAVIKTESNWNAHSAVGCWTLQDRMAFILLLL